MDVDFYSKLVTGIRDYSCSRCELPIKEGEKQIYLNGSINGVFVTKRYHITCWDEKFEVLQLLNSLMESL